MPGKADILGMTWEEVAGIVGDMGWAGYRTGQIYRRLHRDMAESILQITELSTTMRQELSERVEIRRPSIEECLTGSDGMTSKLLMSLEGDGAVEAVLMRYKNRDSLCISSQIGCRYACSFCTTGKMGFVRQLSAGEIIGQIYAASSLAGRRIRNILYMGMGEPFANYDNVLRSIRVLIDDRGYDASQRHVTISTCGIAPAIERFAAEGLQVRLAVSLHAATDRLRDSIMPVNRSWPLPRLIKSCRRYQEITGRRITFEYTVVPGLNDSPEQAKALSALLGGMDSLLNVIPLSSTEKEGPENNAAALRFMKYLRAGNLKATLRESRGLALSAACGQLAVEVKEGKAE